MYKRDPDIIRALKLFKCNSNLKSLKKNLILKVKSIN